MRHDAALYDLVAQWTSQNRSVEAARLISSLKRVANRLVMINEWFMRD
jgi:hypothetical protein